jgi:hypothetical protein
MMENKVVRVVLVTFAALSVATSGAISAVEPERNPFFYCPDLNLPFTHATINSTDHQLLIDTCSTVSFLFAHSAKNARLTDPGDVRVGNARGLSIQLTAHPDSLLALPGLPIRRMTVYSLNGQDPLPLPQRMAGIVGLDYLQNCVIHMARPIKNVPDACWQSLQGP